MSSIDICPKCEGAILMDFSPAQREAILEGVNKSVVRVGNTVYQLCSGHPEIEQTNRDTQFALFAHRLSLDLLNIKDVGIYSMRADWRKEWEQTIARRVYDLVSHTLHNTGPMMLDCYSHEEQIAAIPDMRQWPEETSK